MSNETGREFCELKISDLDEKTADLVLGILKARLAAKELKTNPETRADPVNPPGGGGSGNPKCVPKCRAWLCKQVNHGHEAFHSGGGWLNP